MTKFEENQSPRLTFLESAAPGTPASGLGYLYEKTDNKLYFKNDAGTETELTAAGSAALILLEQHTASASAQLDFTTFISSTYDTYRIVGSELVLATNSAHLYLEMGTGGGPTYDTGNNYEWSGGQGTTGGTGIVAPDFASTGICRIFATAANAAGYGFGTFDLLATGLQSTALRKTVYGTQYYVTSTGPKAILGAYGMQWTTTATAVTALRFIASSGNITSGTIRIYGITK